MAIHRKYKRFRNILVIMILCISILPVLVIGIAVPAQFARLYTDKTLQEIGKFVRNKGLVIDLFFEERLGQLKNIGEMHSYAELTSQGKLSELLRILKANTQAIVDLGVIDMQGHHVVYAGPYDVGTANYAEEDWFNATRRQGLHVSDVLLGFRQSPHIALAVLCGDGKQSWILRATINTSMLTYIVQDNRTGEEGDIFILNENGLLQTDSSIYGPALTSMSAGWPDKHAAISLEKIGDHKYIVATSPLQRVPWILAYAETATFYSGILTRTFIMSAAGIFLSLLALGISAWFTARMIMRKLMEADKKRSLYEDSLLQANKIAAMEKFTLGIVEEMNEPITLLRETGHKILGMLGEEKPQAMQHHGEISDAAHLIEDEANRSIDILCRLLAFAKKLNPFFESLPLHAILNQAIALIQQEADDLGTEIIREFGQPEARVFTDDAQLQQVLINLIENALEATGENGAIIISSDIEDGVALIRVKDNGPGIPKEKLLRIFDSLYPEKERKKGSGLGLAIADAIIRRLGGSLEAASSLEEGTVFTIRLPLDPPEAFG
ncbi:ATP-binding protein [Desulfococcaceae bacterium OttesenSCG-928-F15]|nr:ATP-binding protein [Desulfococcaceae bacterium OttesenSCG-928-F15]